MKLQVSTIILLLLITMVTSAQIKYFPNVFFDIDEDGTKDITFNYHSNSFGYYTVDSQDDLEIEFAANGSYVNYLEFNDTISKNLDWKPSHIYLYSVFEGKAREWGNTQNYYFIGIRIKKNSTYYYGWIRFNSKYGDAIGRDFAIQSEPDKHIKSGEGIVSITPVYDNVFNNDNDIDIHVAFFPPYQSLYVSEYRLYIVKSSKANEVNIDTLLSVQNSNFQVVTPGSLRYHVDLNSDLPTIDNDTVSLDEKYRICILAYSNKVDSFPHSYILTDTVAINVSTVSVEVPAAFDAGDNGDSKDIQIKFRKSSKENFIEEYKLMILPADSAVAFNLKKAVSVPAQFAYSITPSNDSLYTIENILLTDIYGNKIRQNNSYNTFILSVHDGINSNLSSLSSPSNVFVLNKPQYIYAGQTEGEHIVSVLDYHKESLDFDYDGKTDITIRGIFQESNTRYIVDFDVFPGENTEIIHSESRVHNNMADNLAENTPVFYNSYWSSNTLKLIDIHNSYDPTFINEYGEFDYHFEGFIGFRKIAERDTIYGWASFAHGYIKRYALQYYSKLLFISTIENVYFTFYPNPNSDRILNIGISELVSGNDNYIDILNSTGTLVNSYRIEEKLFQISIANLRRGLYFVRLRMSDKQITNKLIIL